MNISQNTLLMFLIDKYAPQSVADMCFHKKIIRQLELMSKKDNMPHILIYGPADSGKKRLVQIFLELIFDKTVRNLQKADFQVLSTGTSCKTTVQLEQSNHHIIIPSNNNNFDKHIIHDVVGEYARTIPLAVFSTKRNFKVVLIREADKLLPNVQAALRRMMELYSTTCKFILVCTKLSSITEPIRSRCNPIRVSSPTDSELLFRLVYISAIENIQLSYRQYLTIIRKAQGQIKTALWMLEYEKLNQTLFRQKPISNENSFECIITKILKLLHTPNIKKIATIRTLLYDIFVTNVDVSKIIISILNELINMNTLKDSQLVQLIDIAEEYEHKLVLARRQAFQLEAFIIHVFYVINKDALNKK